ncbi:MAG: hypothetical protein IJT36_07860 [Alphaproteobacteria bacterium]|nr:hypothetical protein [Alphaproteobacteria bacterium]
MLKKFFVLMFLLSVLCQAVSADVICRSINDDDYFVYTRLSIDTSGNFKESSFPLTAEDWQQFFIVKVNNKELLMVFNRGDDTTGNDEYDTIISTFDMNNFNASNPIATRKFSYSELPANYSAPVVFGNNVLIAGNKNHSIVEIDPMTLSVIQNYSYVTTVNGQSENAAAEVTVSNGKIYATLQVYDYDKLTTSSVRASDGGPQNFSYFVEMSKLGTITKELSDLYVNIDCSNLRDIDGNLYVDYVKRSQRVGDSPEKGIYRLSKELDPDKKIIIVFPEGVSTFAQRKLSCSDGKNGFYFVGYESSGKIFIYHYNGSALNKAYTFTQGNCQEIKYDKQSGFVFLINSAITSGNDNSPKLLALKPDSSGNLTLVKEINRVLWFELSETSNSSTAPNTQNNTQKENVEQKNDNQSNTETKELLPISPITDKQAQNVRKLLNKTDTITVQALTNENALISKDKHNEISQISGETIVAKLPETKVLNNGIYLIKVSFDESVAANKTLIWHSYPENSTSNAYYIAENNADGVFIGDNGEELVMPLTNSISGVTVAAYFEANKKYSPIVSTQNNNNNNSNNNSENLSRSSGSGCNSGQVLLGLALVLFLMKRKNITR